MTEDVEFRCPCCRAGLVTLGRLIEYHEQADADLKHLNSLPEDVKTGLREMADQGRKNRAAGRTKT